MILFEIARLETNQISSTLEDTNVNSVFHDVFDENAHYNSDRKEDCAYQRSKITIG